MILVFIGLPAQLVGEMVHYFVIYRYVCGYESLDSTTDRPGSGVAAV
jgi:hypothetical protein